MLVSTNSKSLQGSQLHTRCILRHTVYTSAYSSNDVAHSPIHALTNGWTLPAGAMS